MKALVGAAIALLLLSSCSSESEVSVSGIDTRGPQPEYWDFEELDTFVAPVESAPSGQCSIGLQCSFAIADEPKIGCKMTVSDGSTVLYDSYAGVERRGRSSLQFDKPNYSLELRLSDGITNNPTNLLGMGKEEDWILDGSWIDRSFVRNQLAADLFVQMDDANYAAEGRYCTLQLDGEPQGIYRLVERPKRDDDRASFDEDDGSGTSFMIRQNERGSVRFRLGLERNWRLTYPNRHSATEEQQDGIQQWLEDLSDVLYSDAAGSEQKNAFDFLSEQSVVDWILVQEFAKNVDAYKLSVHLYKDANTKARLIPWDFDLAFGQPSVRSWDADSPSSWIGERTNFLEGLLAQPGLGDRLAERWSQARESAFTEQNINTMLSEYEQRLQDSLAENFDIWPLEDVNFRMIYAPYRLYEVDSHAEEMTKLRAWITSRLSWMDENIGDFVQAETGR